MLGKSKIGREHPIYELVQGSEKYWYINCPAKIGVYAAAHSNAFDARNTMAGSKHFSGMVMPIQPQ